MEALSKDAGVPLKAKLGWAFGQFAIAAHMAIISIYLLFFLTDVHGFPGTLAGTLILVPRIWNIVTDPMIGGISDRVKTRWGRRRPFLLAGSLVWGFAFVMMFAIPAQWSIEAKSIWFVAWFLVVNTGLSLYHVPYSAMAPEMTRDASEQMSLISYKEITARISVLLAIAAGPLLVGLSEDPATGYRWLGLAIGGGIALSGIVAFVTTRHAPAINFAPQSLGWREQIATLAGNRQLRNLTGSYALVSATDAFYSAIFIYFVTASLHLPESVTGTTYPIGSLASILMIPVWARIALRLGKPRAGRFAYFAIGAVFLLSLLLPTSSIWTLYPFMALLGAGLAGIFLLPNVMVLDVIEDDERVSGMRREGTIYGIWVFIQQTGMAIGSFMVGVYIDLVGYQPGHVSGAQETSIRVGFALVPAVLLLLAALLIRNFRPVGARR